MTGRTYLKHFFTSTKVLKNKNTLIDNYQDKVYILSSLGHRQCIYIHSLSYKIINFYFKKMIIFVAHLYSLYKTHLIN